MMVAATAWKQRGFERNVSKLGTSEAFDRFISAYGSVSTRASYASAWVKYLEWLRAQGISLSLDDLIVDNLKCVYESAATDVRRKRTHTDWLSRYVNGYLLKKGESESSRLIAASAILKFYERNDSPLFGSFEVSKQAPKQQPKPLSASDIKAVLKAIKPLSRVPLIVAWQSGMEINRVLGLKWGDLEGLDRGEHPLKLAFVGRKKHRRPYFTYIGRDSIEALKLLRTIWVEKMGRPPSPSDFVFIGQDGDPADMSGLNDRLKRTALLLSKSGQVQNADPRSWHNHSLRHSFETEGSHSGAKKEIRGFFMGHVSDIMWVYNASDEIHEGDLRAEYLKMEPYLSLDETETKLRTEFEAKQADIVSRYEQILKKYEEVAQELAQIRQEVAPKP
jgi:integrase